MFDNVHHIAFALRDMEAARTQMESVFGLELAHSRTMTENFNLEIAMYFAGESLIELISPLSEEGWTHEFIRDNGEGLFHVAFEVDDVRERMAELAARGIEFEEGDPRPGPNGAWEVATIENDTVVMMQIVEQSKPLREALDAE
ncbi:VOC family protein [Halopenitus salinus]|uniref:VOC family protein n=1 Tax=Halopenitus salinus TaxID=1198295 RepID=A0ABD5UZ30_9EURY